MRIAGRGEIEMWEGGSLWLLEAESERAHVGSHAHHAIQATFSIRGSMEVSTDRERIEGTAIAVAADAEHSFEASGQVAFLFIEPESPAGRALTWALFGRHSLARLDLENVSDLVGRLRDRSAPSRAGEDGLASIGRALIERLACTCASAPLDRRVQAMIDYASANLDKPISLASATSHIGLSPSRLRHLFVAETGLAFKTYVLWLRMKRALECYAAGAALTDAAHEAGFADSAHLSRTFRRTFGISGASLRLIRE